jgi:hypothetical protein
MLALLVQTHHLQHGMLMVLVFHHFSLVFQELQFKLQPLVLRMMKSTLLLLILVEQLQVQKILY